MYNYQAAPINLEALASELKGHPDKLFVQNLLQGLQFGFHTGINNPPLVSLECKNLMSARKMPEVARDMVQSELQKKVICLGPFFLHLFLILE